MTQRRLTLAYSNCSPESPEQMRTSGDSSRSSQTRPLRPVDLQKNYLKALTLQQKVSMLDRIDPVALKVVEGIIENCIARAQARQELARSESN